MTALAPLMESLRDESRAPLGLPVTASRNSKPGVYVVSVTGNLPQGSVQGLKRWGVANKSRDTAVKT